MCHSNVGITKKKKNESPWTQKSEDPFLCQEKGMKAKGDPTTGESSLVGEQLAHIGVSQKISAKISLSKKINKITDVNVCIDKIVT
jgi:hypothetical protein